jgi:hypothetical protein
VTRLLQLVFLGCLVLLPVACVRSDALPAPLAALPALATAPRQSAIDTAPLTIAMGGVDYRVEPSYRYALDGLVVSYRVHDADHLLHRLWNDHLNVADVCVVWGNNAANVDLQAFDFENGEFTCMYRTHDETAWRAFRQDEISNNHLITADPLLRRRIENLAVGDQIHFDGYLASYANGTGFSRGTSTTRSDTGNGACETVYLTDFDVIAAAPRGWRHLQTLAEWGLVISATLWGIGVVRGWL